MSSAQNLQPHPRRAPAHRSVSLVHSQPSQHLKPTPTSYASSAIRSDQPERSFSGSPSSLKPLTGRDDSRESSNADKWFEKSNNHASASYVDDSPPFFFQNSSSEDTGPAIKGHLRNASNEPLPLRAGMARFDTENSGSEDFRSVIDDLTVENKKLKRKLKSYQKLQDSHLKDQKLFEVRVHGLSADKKRELEEMLRKFAISLNGQPGSEATANMYSSMMPAALVPQKSGSSLASNQNADSAYASASASGQGSSAQSGSDTRKRFSGTKSQQNVHSYLHDIPEGLMPQQHPTAMTEKAKKKLVVRRLEHIFAGNRAAASGHQQPMQQQEVSQLAAKADRSLYEDRGQQAPAEGVREARIMQNESEDQAPPPHAEVPEFKQNLAPSAKVNEQDFAARDAEQRPTRPLDLDPHRAQIPADNILYIRHLGFSPPGVDAMEPPTDGHGWIYLNLLSNMAQLHTMHVTSEFISKALHDYSKMFEVSTDGRKVRWKGGMKVSKTSSDGNDTPSVGNSGFQSMSSERGSPRKRIKMAQRGDSSGSSNNKAKSNAQTPADARFSYTPLFYHRSASGDSEESSDEDEETEESLMPLPQGDTSGMTSSGMRTTSTKRKRVRETGPIIFYNNAKFCTDLSGDSKTEEAMVYNAFLYHSVGSEPVGVPPTRPSEIPLSEMRGPLSKATQLPEPMDLDDNPIPSDQELTFPPQTPLSSQAGKDRKTYNLEASGIGGVFPADNFAINVQSLHSRLDNVTAPETVRDGVPTRYPGRIASLLEDNASGRKSRSAFHKQVISTAHEDLPPSELPHASCFMPVDGDTSPEDDESNTGHDDDDMYISPISPDGDIPAAAPQPMVLDYASTVSGDENEDSDDDSDDGSLDLLATARELDPEAIRKCELEYDANLAERLAEEIPAGSSAATAGGGSGFNSPASTADVEESDEVRKKRRDARRLARAASKQPSLKRARTDDSTVVNGKHGDSEMMQE